MQTHTFTVRGMHCASCVGLTESELTDVPGVATVHASLATHSVTVTGDFGDASAEAVAEKLTAVLKPHGYTLGTDPLAHTPQWGEFRRAIPYALCVIALFVLLQKLGLVNLITTADVRYGTAFLIGGIASVSTCMAVVGGLALSVSTNFAKEGDPVRPQIAFHAGRLLSFFFLGGVIGALGAVFEPNTTWFSAVSLCIAFILLVLGINLLDIFPWMKKLQPTLPAFLGKRVHGLKKINHTVTPLLLGIATFFLPCGFTQSMQLYTLTTGSFWRGALLMSAFALGTLPVLALLSFGALGVRTKAQSGVFFKAAGLVVLFFAVFNGLSALVAAGLIPPFFSL